MEEEIVANPSSMKILLCEKHALHT